MKKPLYVLDIESTGLAKDKCQILQIALVKMDSFNKSNSEYDKLNLFIRYETLTYVEPQAATMVANTLNNMENAPTEDIVGLHGAHIRVNDFFAKHHINGEKFVLAGKNVSTFDLPILLNNKFDMYNVSHRVLDVGSMYYEDFGYIPNLNEINKLLGAEDVVHDGLADCYNIIDAIKYKMRK